MTARLSSRSPASMLALALTTATIVVLLVLSPQALAHVRRAACSSSAAAHSKREARACAQARHTARSSHKSRARSHSRLNGHHLRHHSRYARTRKGTADSYRSNSLVRLKVKYPEAGTVAKAPLGPKEPSSGWSVEYGDAFARAIGSGSGQDNTWFPNNCSNVTYCEGFNSNEMEVFAANKVSVDSEGLKLACTHESHAGKSYVCGVAKGTAEAQPGYKNFTWSAGHGAALVFQAVAKFPPNTDEADPGWWSDGPPWGGTEFDFFEGGGWGSQHTTGWKTDEMYAAWFASPHIGATKYGFATDPSEAFHTYTTEVFPNNTYSEWIDGVLQSWGTNVGPAEPIASAATHLILSYALRTCSECSTGFTSGTRYFDVRSIAVYEDKAHRGAGLAEGGLAPGTSVAP